MLRRLWIVAAVVLSLMVPSVAHAEGMESFTRGLNDFAGNGTNEQVTPESDFMESYEPQEVVLSSPAAREYDENSTTVDYINGTLDAFNGNSWLAATGGLLGDLRTFFLHGTMHSYFLLPAAGLVFMWWGVRKALRMLMSGFRKGKASV